MEQGGKRALLQEVYPRLVRRPRQPRFVHFPLRWSDDEKLRMGDRRSDMTEN